MERYVKWNTLMDSKYFIELDQESIDISALLQALRASVEPP